MPVVVYDALQRRIPPSLHRVVRFIMAGGVVAVVNLGTDVVLIAFGVPVQLTVALAYLAAITTHFTLQRLFVFAGEGEFALTLGQQMRRYVAMAAVQYPTTAALAALGVAIGLSDLVAVMAAAILVTPATYFVLRTRMFHLAAGDEEDAQHDVGERRIESRSSAE